MPNKPTWPHGAVMYQIYPRSFYDTSGSGTGTIQGIIQKLDYLGGNDNALGVTAIWLSPIYKSPMADFGYDVSDYQDVDPIFGSLADMEQLIHEAHQRGLKVILDFVPNHTSDEHPWFVEASASKNNSKRDWYIWRDAKPDGGLPNNWLGVFGSSAWKLSEATGQYYLHSFLTKQPDLNWDNPELRAAMKDMMRFWLDKGVDGLRMDAVDWLSKDPEMRDDPIIESASSGDYGSLKHEFSREGPDLLERLSEMAAVMAEYDERYMILEAHPEIEDKISGYLQYYQGVDPRYCAPFAFEPMYLPWQASAFRNFIDRYQADMKADYNPVYVLGNHDEPRFASRNGVEQARTAAMALLTLPGTAVVYYGEELGMTSVSIPADRVRDPFVALGEGRDPARTPMQWDDSANAGFTNGEPWLPLADDYAQHNVVAETQDPASFLNLYKRLIAFRKSSEIVSHGSYQPYQIADNADQLYAYKRVHKDAELLVVLNFSDQVQATLLPEITGRVQLSTYLDNEGNIIDGQVELRPHEGVILRLN